MNALRALYGLRLIVIPTALCGAIMYKGQCDLSKKHTDKPRLVYVHVYCRHGHRTPSFPIHADIEYETKLWSSLLAKPYYSSSASTSSAVDACTWKSVNSKLRGTYLQDIHANASSIDQQSTLDEKPIHSTWPKSQIQWTGQLTQAGALQMEELGRWLRRRYVDETAFLPSTYGTSYATATKLHVECTNYRRTIYSADSLLYGLYGQTQRRPADTIALHMDPQHHHYLYTPFECRRYYDEFFGFIHSLQHEIMPPQIAATMRALQQLFGGAPAAKLTAALDTRLQQNVDVPTEIEIADLRSYVQYMYARSRDGFLMRSDMLRISNGVLCGRLLHAMKYEDGKFVISSGHDFTLITLLCSLYRKCRNEKMLQWPPHGSSIVFEVWEEANEEKKIQRMVRMLYNKQVIYMNGQEFTALDDLENMWNDLLISEQTLWNSECCC